jgi:hypothetical protein
MMLPELRDAIESARTCARSDRFAICLHPAETQYRHSFNMIRIIVLSVMQELPEDMTVREICDELGNANSQFEDQTR